MGRVIVNTFGVMRRNPIQVFLLCLFVYVLSLGLNLGSVRFIAVPQSTAIFVRAVVAILSYLAFTFVYAAVCWVVHEDSSGRKTRLAEAVQIGLKRLLPLFLLVIVSLLGFAAGLVLLVIPGLILAVRYFVSGSVCVIEGEGVKGSLRRSAALTKGHRWKLLVLLILIYAVSTVLTFIPILIYMKLAGGFMNAMMTYQLAGVSVQLAAAPLTIFAVALQYVSANVVYCELRRVKEAGLPQQLAAVFS